jgi:hypothetical protein
VEALLTIVGLPQRSTISELIIKPTIMRNAVETAQFP